MARSTPIETWQQTIIYPFLSLTLYREIAAHLEQVNGVRTTLTPQTSDRFDYQQSQIGSLKIDYAPEFDARDRVLVEAILGYYAHRHGSYQLF
jgi:hypothetical protein